MAQHYTLRALTPAQQGEWDAFVAGHERGHFLQSWGWGELKAIGNWRPLRLALYEEGEQKIVAGAQVLCRTVSRIPSRLGNLAYVPKGPVLDWRAGAADLGLGDIFLARLRDYLRHRGTLALQIEPHLEEGTVEAQKALACLKTLDFASRLSVQPLRTIALDIQPVEESLLVNMKEKWRYNIRLSARKGVEVREVQTLAELEAWYALLQATGERDQFGIHTFAYYRRAWEIFQPRGQARIFLAYTGDEILAGIFVGLLAGEAIYMYGASSNERRNLMPNYLLQWKAICWAKAAGARVYDFWGIPETDADDEAMAGVYRFKSGWGGRVIRFMGNYEYIYRPLAVNMVRRFLAYK